MDLANKLVKETTTMAVYRRLYDLVLSGRFQPGEWIRERELKEMLGVSSTPIREAMRMLVQERILESVPHHGVRVKELSMKELKDLYELRAELEGMAARLAAERGSSTHFKQMENLLNLEQQAHSGNTGHATDAIELNNRFHDLVVEAGGNLALKSTLHHLRAGISWIQVMAWNRNKERHALTDDQHRGIWEALANRDPRLAQARMHEHIWDTISLMLKSRQEDVNEQAGES
ncbi:DNA-binding GntR family transcriptional regulator [Paenibacillus forsythiae]|uniref:DNA-binding GntR family transcriptional regulator n=1 Tax=Paenibacillus forsythiae TaxID=365616 RepID=A0ABU3HC47_9BACL|nr:GntR family transcriptional regulator [Paenibacillus forsythiae]MDT3428394.1 DNA-binding GntR family transcriptional regulator [Paenibacillus forsythiae]